MATITLRKARTIIAKALAKGREDGMKPLAVRKEIDAHIADRFLEAVWREGLWLIQDGVATTEEIDDAIRFGFGLRWAQMGLFETYRVESPIACAVLRIRSVVRKVRKLPMCAYE